MGSWIIDKEEEEKIRGKITFLEKLLKDIEGGFVSIEDFNNRLLDARNDKILSQEDIEQIFRDTYG
jgi:hypothetical protein